MNKLHDAIDRFCALHRGFGIPNLMRYIVTGNVLVFALHLLTGADGMLLSLLSLTPRMIVQGLQLWRLVTFVFIPFSTDVLSLVLSLYLYYYIGNVLEDRWGTGKFTIYYLSGILFSIIGAFAAYALGSPVSVWGLHYVNMSLFLAYAVLYSDAYLYLFFLIPIKIKWLAWLDVAYFAYGVLLSIGQRDWGNAVMPVVALLNFAIFFYPYISRSAQTARYRNSRQAVDFKRAVREQRRAKGYNHKCEIWGRTDADHPDLQFRYCSQCEGYHCYCQDHIYDHPHHH